MYLQSCATLYDDIGGLPQNFKTSLTSLKPLRALGQMPRLSRTLCSYTHSAYRIASVALRVVEIEFKRIDTGASRTTYLHSDAHFFLSFLLLSNALLCHYLFYNFIFFENYLFHLNNINI